MDIEEVSDMKAEAGDELVIRGTRMGQPDRRGEILECRGPDGGAPYIVRWDDSGHTTVLYPGSDCEVHPLAHRQPDTDAAPPHR
jgi:hypothetical protein